jgi:tripartite-type tricarboxylate transporter receptor subunit TctC
VQTQPLIRLQLAASLMFIVCASPSYAQTVQDYLSRPIRFIAPTSPGGANDVLARILGVRMTENWKQQVVVDVRPGAGGIVGSELAARAASDGYTVLDAIGFDVENRGPAQFTAFVQTEMTKWGKIFAERGIKPE